MHNDFLSIPFNTIHLYFNDDKCLDDIIVFYKFFNNNEKPCFVHACRRLYYFCIVKIINSIIFSIKKYYSYYHFINNNEYFIYNILNNYYINNETLSEIIVDIYNQYCIFDNLWIDKLKKLIELSNYSIELQVDFLIHLQHKNGIMFDESFDQLYNITNEEYYKINLLLELKELSL